MAASSISFILGSAAGNAEVAINLLPLMLVPQILFSGFVANTSAMPVWIRWVQWTCAMKYAMNLLLLEEFDPSHVPENRTAFTKALLDRTEVNGSSSSRAFYALVLVGLGLALRLLTLLVLRRKARSAFS
eukprot:Hpha_TRINITY_DN36422_c0_g1::TRINITY_DN36422_c0_g1_i1::g.20073::m.20073